MEFLRTTLLFLIFFVLLPYCASGKTIIRDTVWKGEITLTEDIVVPEGVTLTILSGTMVNIIPSDRTKNGAEYLSFMTEMTIRGRLVIDGTREAPVVFQVKNDKPDRWAGIIIDRGNAYIKACRIEDAETGLLIMNGSLELTDSIIENNRYGLIAQGPQAFVSMKKTQVANNDYGVFAFAGAKVNYKKNIIADNRKRDLYLIEADKVVVLKPDMVKPEIKDLIAGRYVSCNKPATGFMKEYKALEKEVTKVYNDEVLPGDTVWRGRIVVNGLIRVPEKVRLVIVPGTVIEFTKKDTNGDGIGENGLLMQGVLIAKGTRDNPIIFRSAGTARSMGDWDGINIMNSDGAQNLVEYCRIEDAYRGLHFHFSNVMVQGSVLSNNYRAIQFQESAVEMKGNYIFNNKSGVKGRDSEIVFTDNYVYNNINGVNFFRSSLSASNNKILGNMNEGFKIREGVTNADENFIGCGRYGMMVNDAFHGKFSGNVIVNNYESGLSLKGSDNIEVSENFIQGNGFNGINLQDSRALIKDNFILGNGERGIGVQSFTGIITENSIASNGLCAIENESAVDIFAPSNWWGGKDAGSVIYDKEDDPGRGRILYAPIKENQLPFTWPVKDIFADITWLGDIILKNSVNVSGVTLELSPATKISFLKGTGIKILSGKILATGKEDGRIVFTSEDKNKDDLWDEILLEHADGSEFSFCDFEYATWAIHSHFTNLKISNSRFLHNYGGLRFRSGPVEVRYSLFKENNVGIRSYFGNALVEGNVILNNEVGIFVREKGGGITIKNNNIYSNKAYNLRVGDFNTEDVDARENWWGVDDPAATIFDARREPGIGEVIYKPFFKEQLELRWRN
ncbi:MAG: right-handed parallel beta-helix repeat-containing protein [Nitrospirae bacterium]|nr:right-handed parallel beta-helix repeat-containing protein [Nitrospirota bacterium]